MFGAVIGPNMLDVLPRFAGLQAVGSIGVLYLIFLAGLQLDLEAFVRYRVISGGFGLLTSAIPMALGTGAALLLGIDLRPALLIGSFWASFTLIAYPTVAKYGLTKTRPVAAIVGASAITDGVSLVVLALIVGAETGDASGARLVFDIAIGFAVLGVYCFVVVPAIARWFFTGLGQERTLRYMLVFIGLTSSAVVAELVGVEPLIGAFFVGVGLNRFVPNASPLMAVTDFFGNAFFIPTFLVSVGLLFDPEVMFEWSTIRWRSDSWPRWWSARRSRPGSRGASSVSSGRRSGCCSRCRSRRQPPRWLPPSSASTSACTAATWSTP
jgi:Kef-type K+ transport system membrane component KefB